MPDAVPQMTDEDWLKELQKWYALEAQLKNLKGTEAMLRLRLFDHFFVTPDEGVNTRTDIFPNGAQVKGERTINRSVDEGALNVLRQRGAPTEEHPDGTPSEFEKVGVNPDTMFRWKPELVLKNYRKATVEQLHVIDQALIIKDGMPGLEIKPPSSRSTKKGTK